MKTAAELVSELRKKEGMSQEEFAKKLGYTSKSTINKIEKGINDISYEKLVKLIEEYRLTYKDFQSNSELETNRLILRHLKDSDLESVFYNYANDDEVTKYLSWPTHKSLDDTKKIFDIWKNDDELKKKYHYFVILKETNELIGSVDVVTFIDGNPEIGIVLGRKWWNQGIMTEATKKLIDVLFKDGYKKIIMKAMKENIASNRLINKCGFNFIGEEEFPMPLKNKVVICNVYELHNLKERN